MRIAMFTEVFAPKVDGIVTRLTNTVTELTNLGHDVCVIAPGPGPDTYGGIPVFRLPSAPFKPWYPEVRVGMPTFGMSASLNKFRPDIIHAVNPVAAAAWGIVHARTRRLPLLASYHTALPQYTQDFGLPVLRKPSQAWIRQLHNRADVNLCPSQPMVEEARALGIQRVGLWPKAVDTEKYQPTKYSGEMRERLTGGHPEAPLMLCVGRLSAEKNLLSLRPLMDRLPGVRLALVGSGPYENELKKAFTGTNTVFTGYLHGEELASAFASSDVFVFPSLTDTLGNVAFEAMASGTPVVGANAGGIPDIIKDGENGFLVDPADTAVFADRVNQILTRPDLAAALTAGTLASARGRSWRAAPQSRLFFNT
ncbi:glycosyltransferase [Flaviflexus massiliensis]|uniref:glycosyltransferase n=1 Tax=Flaviflexus massiliensis TaxID=1522309 RepID=UPI0011CA2AB9|nr:glycosyltransferase [Flaviflexus massiliensis]